MLALSATLLLLSGNWSSARAIANGTAAPDTALDRATVWVGGCSGTLVAPDLVLTAGHCLPARPAIPAGEEFRTFSNPERPDRFYRFAPGGGIQIIVDDQWNAVCASTDPSCFRTTAVEYALPGLTDMALVRLQRPVPASAATPISIVTTLSYLSDPSGWLRPLTLLVAGWGNDQTGFPSANLRQGLATNATFPCSVAAYMICSQSADGSGTRNGDSGGPLYWTDSAGTRKVLGVLQMFDSSNGSDHKATFYRGGANYDSLPYPNLGDWLERMVYGREGHTAFLFAANPTSADHYVSRDYAANPSGRLAHVERTSPGVYRARFEGLRHTPEREPRVAFVTAYGFGSSYCKLRDASAADSIEVRCFDASGAPADSWFSLLSDFSDTDFLIRAPRLVEPSVTLARASIRRLAPGLYDVTPTAWTGGAWKNVIVTAEGPGSARCHADYWWSNSARVRCVDHAGGAVDSGFTLGATAGNDSSYALGHWPTTSSYTSDSSFSSVASSSSAPTITHGAAPGVYLVAFAGAPRNIGGNVQVTAYGSTTNHCKVGSWGQDNASVFCFDAAGNPADTRFVVRYVDPLDVGRRVTVQLNQLRATSSDSCGGLDMYGSLRFLAGATGSVTIPRVDDADVRRFAPPVALTARSTPGARYVDAELDVRDDDDFLCGGGDDVVDLVPHPEVQDLRIRIDLQAHTVEMLDSVYPTIGGVGNWTTDGRNGNETAQADFTVMVS
jgi:Trypsin